MLPRRCLPSWLGQQLHANGGGDLASAGLSVALLVRFWRGPCRVARQGSCRGTHASSARILPGVLWVPSARMAAFPSSVDLDCPLSSQRSACHHRGAFLRPGPMLIMALGAVGSRVAHSVGV